MNEDDFIFHISLPRSKFFIHLSLLTMNSTVLILAERLSHMNSVKWHYSPWEKIECPPCIREFMCSIPVRDLVRDSLSYTPVMLINSSFTKNWIIHLVRISSSVFVLSLIGGNTLLWINRIQYKSNDFVRWWENDHRKRLERKDDQWWRKLKQIATWIN